MYPWRARVSTVRRQKPLVLPVTRIVCAIGISPFFTKQQQRLYALWSKKRANCRCSFGEQRQKRPRLLFPNVAVMVSSKPVITSGGACFPFQPFICFLEEYGTL